MGKKRFVVAGCILIACLTACQGGKATAADKNWAEAKKADSLEAYIGEQGETIDVEALKAEAGSAEGSLGQQFKAAALLSGLEYWNAQEDGGDLETADVKAAAFQSDYPVSGPYVEQYLKKAATQGEAFWESLDEAFYPYDCFLPMLAAADGLDGQTLAALTGGIPEDTGYASKLEDAIGEWVKNKPEKIVAVGGDFINSDFFGEWDLDDWRGTYFYNYSNPGAVKTETAEEALAYIGFLRGTMLPKLEEEYGKDQFTEASELGGTDFYSTKLTVTVGAPLPLQEPAADGLPETIETEGKKVAAFYRNPHTEEFAGSPAPLRMMGDFMLNLPQEAFPASMDEADYYLVLTSEYESGDYYKDQAGNDTKIQQVYSSTSVDLYEAGTGVFLRHLGNVEEKPASSVYKNLFEEQLQYPDLVSADLLSFLYSHINEPDTYISLTDQVLKNTELKQGESVVLGSLKITFHSGKFVKSFDEDMYRYTAEDGTQFYRGEFTVENIGTERVTFLPRRYYEDRDPIVKFADSERETFYTPVDAMTSGKCLNGTFLETGESKDGYLIFEVPDEVIEAGEPCYVAATLGRQAVYYMLEQ